VKQVLINPSQVILQIST